MSILSNPGDSPRENALTLHLDREAFANFVLSFLGKKETLTYQAQLAFVIRLNDIEQFCRLLQAKLDKESNVYVDHFLAEFSYNDNTSRSISGIAALGRFLETRDVYPASVTLTWNIILKLPNAGSIENQVVELSFLTNRKGAQFRKGSVVLSIKHTNQAWGIEVLNLLKDKIADVTIRDSNSYMVAKKWRDRIAEYGLSLAMVWFLAFFPILLAFAPVGNRSTEKDYYLLAESIHESGVDSEPIVAWLALEKMSQEGAVAASRQFLDRADLRKMVEDRVENRISSSFRLRWVSLSWIGIGGALLIIWLYLGKLVSYYAVSSYILISNRAEKERAQEMESKNRAQLLTLTMFVFSVACGVFGNMAYAIIVMLSGR